MLTDCESRKIDIILTKSISRFARNTVDLLETVLTSIPHKFSASPMQQVTTKP